MNFSLNAYVWGLITESKDMKKCLDFPAEIAARFNIN